MTAIERSAALIKGLFETHLDVADLERSVNFYEKVLGLQLGTRDDTSACFIEDSSRSGTPGWRRGGRRATRH